MIFFIIFEDFEDVVLLIKKIKLKEFKSIVQENNVIFNFIYVRLKELR